MVGIELYILLRGLNKTLVPKPSFRRKTIWRNLHLTYRATCLNPPNIKMRTKKVSILLLAILLHTFWISKKFCLWDTLSQCEIKAYRSEKQHSGQVKESLPVSVSNNTGRYCKSAQCSIADFHYQLGRIRIFSWIWNTEREYKTMISSLLIYSDMS